MWYMMCDFLCVMCDILNMFDFSKAWIRVCPINAMDMLYRGALSCCEMSF
jgi:hypothetical protein